MTTSELAQLIADVLRAVLHNMTPEQRGFYGLHPVDALQGSQVLTEGFIAKFELVLPTEQRFILWVVELGDSEPFAESTE